MCHLRAQPGDPGFDAAKGIDYVLEKAHADLHELQAGGGDAEAAAYLANRDIAAIAHSTEFNIGTS